MREEWNLTNLPPEGHEDVAEFFYMLYETALAEQERLKIRQRALDNHALYRGYRGEARNRKRVHTPVNLFFSNVERTVANVTAANPTAEVVDMDGIKDEGEEVMTARLKNWWKETHQRQKHRDSARAMEIYGFTTEKPFWDSIKKRPNQHIMDPFAVVPAPGVFQNWATDLPYICFLYADSPDSVEALYGVKGVAADYRVGELGEQREEHVGHRSNTGRRPGSKSYTGNYASAGHAARSDRSAADGKPFEKALVIEIWIRNAEGTISEENPVVDEQGAILADENTGQPLIERIITPKYPDGIRKVTITSRDRNRSKGDNKGDRHGHLVLSDSPNPNLNPTVPPRFPRPPTAGAGCRFSRPTAIETTPAAMVSVPPSKWATCFSRSRTYLPGYSPTPSRRYPQRWLSRNTAGSPGQ
jgi:hypothetical protein